MFGVSLLKYSLLYKVSYPNVITALVIGQPITNEFEGSTVTSETSDIHEFESQISESGI